MEFVKRYADTDSRDVLIVFLAIAGIGIMFMVANTEQPTVVKGSQSLIPLTTPFLRETGNGGSANYETLSDNFTYLHASVFSSPIIPNVILPPLPYPSQTTFSTYMPPIVLYYPLDESSGTTANDLSGNLNTGTDTFDVGGSLPVHTSTSCKYGTCLNFIATALGFISVPNSPTLQLNSTGTTIFSFCVWANHGSGGTTYNGIVEGIAGHSATDQRILWGTFSSGHILVQDSGNTNTLTSTAAVSEAEHLICVTYNGTTTSLYIDGTFNISSNTLVFNSGTASMSIGKGDASQYYFQGTLDDIRIYTTALTALQIQQIYEYGVEYSTPVIESVIEFFTPNHINSSVSGTSITWNEEYDTAASSQGYSIYPMGAEEATSATNAVEFNIFNGGQIQCKTISNGVTTSHLVTAPTANVIHTYSIVFTVAGSQLDFYIDGVDVFTATTNIPTGVLLSPFSELGNVGAIGIYANNWTMGNVVIVNAVP